jgi:hypothetical protein
MLAAAEFLGGHGLSGLRRERVWSLRHVLRRYGIMYNHCLEQTDAQNLACSRAASMAAASEV